MTNHAGRLPIYQEIEKERGSRVISLVTGERSGLETQIAHDAYTPLVSLLDEIGPTPKISLLLETVGGHTSAAWKIINLIRSFCDYLEVIVYSKAMSAGTLMALGADKIVMTKQAVLGPIDPSLSNHPLAPTIKGPTGVDLRLPVSAEAVRGYIDEVKKDIKEPSALAHIWMQLAEKVHPLILGDLFRIKDQVRTLASELISSQVTDLETANSIVNLLSSESGSHDYTINRRKAGEIGLNVEKPSHEFYQLLSSLGHSFGVELQTLEPVSPSRVLGGAAQAAYVYVRGLIETTNACFGYVSEGTYAKAAVPTSTPFDQRTFEGWRKLP